MKKNITSPHLRFQEFDEPWENKKLGEVLEIATRINTDNEFDKNSVLSVSDLSFTTASLYESVATTFIPLFLKSNSAPVSTGFLVSD